LIYITEDKDRIYGFDRLRKNGIFSWAWSVEKRTGLPEVRGCCRRGSTEMRLPSRSVLLILKLKAIWDRNYRIIKNRSTDPEWERGKIVKDRADVLALIDPGSGGIELNLNVIGQLFERYPFLVPCFRSVGENLDSITFYGRMEIDTARRIINQILQQTVG
jgi:hypothetical protein